VGPTQEFTGPGTGGILRTGQSYSDKPYLTVTKGPLEGEIFTLDPLPVSIGRDPDCDLFLNNMTVSRRHAVIERDAASNQLLIRDQDSLNGTWVDGKVVEVAELVAGTLVQIGTFSTRVSL
jgi:pSer/pThr/pTyr-binding forkhead associated (FHA) protein